MQLTIHNLTDTVLISHIFAAGEHVLFPNHPTTVKLPKGSENLNLSSCKDILASCDGKWTLPVDQLSVRVKLAFGSSWQEIKVPKDCPLRLYRVRVSTLFPAVVAAIYVRCHPVCAVPNRGPAWPLPPSLYSGPKTSSLTTAPFFSRARAATTRS